MKQNITNTRDRGDKIDNIQENATRIEQDSNKFRIRAKKVKRQMCLSNFKWWLIVGAGVALVIIIVAVCKLSS